MTDMNELERKLLAGLLHYNPLGQTHGRFVTRGTGFLAQPPPSSLLVNPGFEEGVDGLDGWQDTSTGAGTVTVVEGQCVLFRQNGSNSARLFQSIADLPAGDYSLGWDAVAGPEDARTNITGLGPSAANPRTFTHAGGLFEVTFVVNASGSGTATIDNVVLAAV